MVDEQEIKHINEFIANAHRQGTYGSYVISYGHKEVMGQPTPELCIRFSVKKKLPKSEITNPVPKKVVINGKEYITDVIEIPEMPSFMALLSCRSAGEIAQHRNQYRPLIGGIGIGTNNSPWSGTLGGFMRDNRDGKLVGITNNHVITNYELCGLFKPETKIGAPYRSLFWEPQPPSNIDINGKGHGAINVYQEGALIGTPKRRIPFKLGGNTVDAAVINIRPGLLSSASWNQLGGPWSSPPRAASSNEINSLGIFSKVFISGARTGWKGGPNDTEFCQKIGISAVSTALAVGAPPYTINGIPFSEVMEISGWSADGVDFPIVGGRGDSGSFVYAQNWLTGEWLLVGLIFAGAVLPGESVTARMYAIRIDNVMNALDVTSWHDPNYVATGWNVASFIDLPQSSPVYGEPWIYDGDGKKYWLCGEVKKSQLAASIDGYRTYVAQSV